MEQELRVITIHPTDKSKKIIDKNEDMTCEVEIKRDGLYEGTIIRMSSSGVYDVRLTKKIEDK